VTCRQVSIQRVDILGAEAGCPALEFIRIYSQQRIFRVSQGVTPIRRIVIWGLRFSATAA
jgi:hypothetical protein